jgi:ribosomal protein L7/L12
VWCIRGNFAYQENNMRNLKIVKYQVQYSSFEVSEGEYDVIKALYDKDLKVTAIKFLRSQYGLDLKDAKNICDVIGGVR